MEDQIACRIRIGGPVPRTSLNEMSEAIFKAGLWGADDAVPRRLSAAAARVAIVDAAEDGRVLSLENYFSAGDAPYDPLTDVCERYGIDFDLVIDSRGGEPAELSVFRADRPAGTSGVSLGCDKDFMCGHFGEPVVSVKDVLEAIGKFEGDNPLVRARLIRRLRREISYPELTPIKLVD